MGKRTRLLVGGAAATVLAAAVGAGWLAWTASAARAELVAAQHQLPALRAGVLSGDPGVGEQIASVQRHAAAARDATHDPLWRLAAALPWLGTPLATVQGMTEAVDGVAATSLPPLSAAATDIHPARVLDEGRFDVQGLAAAAEPLGVAARSLVAQRDLVGGLSPSWVGAVGAARADLHEQLVSLSALASSAQTAADVAPDMLGRDGPRRYLVAFQNPAEARGTGGLLDAYAIVTATEGVVTVERTGTNAQLPVLDGDVTGIDETFLARYAGLGAAETWLNTNLSPHFPEVAATWVALWRNATGEELDGAIALDPKALAEVLAATGPVRAPVVGTVGADGIESLVLLEQYRRADLAAQRKQLMLGVGVEAMNAVLAGKADAGALLPRLRDAAHGGHLHLYSTAAREQTALVRSELAGAVWDGSGPFAQAVAVNAGGNKLDTWLSTRLDYRVVECSDRRRTVTATVTVLNDAPTAGLPEYVTVRSDDPPFDTVPGQNRVDLQLLVTRGAQVESARLDGAPLPLAPPDGDLPATLPDGGLPTGGRDSGLLTEATTAGRPSYGLDLELVPGVARTLEVRFTEPAGVAGPPRLPVQAMVVPPRVDADLSACGGAAA